MSESNSDDEKEIEIWGGILGRDAADRAKARLFEPAQTLLQIQGTASGWDNAWVCAPFEFELAIT